MINFRGIPIWMLLVCVAITAVPALWKIKRGTVRGPLSISLAGLAFMLEAAAVISLAIASSFASHLQLIALFTLSSWLLETWAKRVKSSPKQNQAELKGAADDALEAGRGRWYSK